MNKLIRITLTLLAFSGLNAAAEISGSGFHGLGCTGEIQLSYFVDSNGDGNRSGSEMALPGLTVTLLRRSAPELGTVSAITDSNGDVVFQNLCGDDYDVTTDADNAPANLSINSVIDHHTDENVWHEGSDSHPFVVALVDGELQSKQLSVLYENSGCALELAAGCAPVPSPFVPATPDYQCDKPVSDLAMIWNGSVDIRVVAHKGKLSDPVIADLDNIAPGTEVRIGGYAGSPSDVIWELYAAGTNDKIGESSFHLSCSDDDMDGPEDCGAASGDGKNNDKCTGGDGACLNDWLFEGWQDKHGEINCHHDYPTDPLVDGGGACEIAGPGLMNLQYRVTNNGVNAIEILAVEDSVLGSLPDLPAGPVGPGATHLVSFADTISATATREISITGQEVGTGNLCASTATVATTVVPLPDPCESVLVNLDGLSHDELKLKLFNNSEQDLQIATIQVAWPAEHVGVREIKFDGQKIMDTVRAWEPQSLFAEADFLSGSDAMIIAADSDKKLEFKFSEHVHDSPQVYAVTVEFVQGCAVTYSNP